MVNLYSHDANTNIPTFTCSTTSDVSTLPTTHNYGTFPNAKIYGKAPHGSTCLVLSTSEVYMLDGEDDTWKVI